MAELPEIDTERLTIVPFRQHHLTDLYVSWLNDPEITKYSQQRFYSHSLESCEAFMRSFEKSTGHFSAIILKSEERKHIGNISTTLDPHNKVADIAILIGEKASWGQGYGLEAWQAVQSCLLNRGLRMITGGCMATNTAMKAIMEKAGMKRYYTRERYFLCNGQEIDSIHYMIDQKSWKS